MQSRVPFQPTPANMGSNLIKFCPPSKKQFTIPPYIPSSRSAFFQQRSGFDMLQQRRKPILVNDFRNSEFFKGGSNFREYGTKAITAERPEKFWNKNEQIIKLTKGIQFNVIEAPEGVDLKGFVDSFFRKPIETSPKKSALGGEKVLTTMHATKDHPSSYFLMHFEGTQDKHFHAGPRLLNIFAHKPWFLYVGGIHPSVQPSSTKNKFPVVKIAFPGNSFTQLRFPKNLIHGFEGDDFGAVSIHYTDREEIKQKALKSKAAADKDIMGKLTNILEHGQLEQINEEPINHEKLAALLGINEQKR